MQNLTPLASAIPEISLGAPKFKIGHVTSTMPILRVMCHFVICMLGLDIAYLCTKYDDSNFTHFTDMDVVGAHQNLMVYVT